MNWWKSIFAISVLALFFCVPQVHGLSEDGELAEEEQMVQALDERENMLTEEQAKENSYDVPQEDDDLMKVKEDDRAAAIRGEEYPGGGWW